MDERQRVLVVDDERLNRKVLSDLLKDAYTVIPAKSGLQALERVADDPPPDLILLDVMMPGMDGYEVIRRLKHDDRAKDIPIIFITALSSADDEEKGLRLGATDYIAKPFHPAIVRARVNNHLRFVRQHKMLEALANLDPLTELFNRRRYEQALDNEWRRAVRNGTPLSLAMVDVDDFKPFNDTYGHARGDDALRAVARSLIESLRRPADLIARYGGEEFVLMFPETEALGAERFAEGMRQAVADLGIEHAGSRAAGYVTVSIGGATVIPMGDASPQILVETADAMLYAAKEAGRNRVRWQGVSSPRPEPRDL